MPTDITYELKSVGTPVKSFGVSPHFISPATRSNHLIPKRKPVLANLGQSSAPCQCEGWSLGCFGRHVALDASRVGGWASRDAPWWPLTLRSSRRREGMFGGGTVLETQPAAGLLSATEFRDFWVRWADQNITLGTGERAAQGRLHIGQVLQLHP